MKQLLILIAVLAAAALPVAAQTDRISQDVLHLNTRMQAATKQYDTATLADLTTDDYQLVDTSGRIWTKKAFLKDAGDRSTVWEINQTEDASVRHYNDDCAIIMAVLHVRYHVKEKVTDVRIRFSDVWVKLNGRWKYASGQASMLKT